MALTGVLVLTFALMAVAAVAALSGYTNILTASNLRAAAGAKADADTLDEWEDVRFSVSDGVVWVTRGVAAPLPLTDGSQTAASHVEDDGLALTYFDGDGDEILNTASNAARASVRRIRVSLTVRGGAAGDDSGPSVTLSQDVFLRNAS